MKLLSAIYEHRGVIIDLTSSGNEKTAQRFWRASFRHDKLGYIENATYQTPDIILASVQRQIDLLSTAGGAK